MPISENWRPRRCKFNPNDPINQFRPHWRQLLTSSGLLKGTAFAKGIGERWDSWASLSDDQIATRAAEIRKERNALLDRARIGFRKVSPSQKAILFALPSWSLNSIWHSSSELCGRMLPNPG